VLQFLESLEATGYIERTTGARNIRVLHLPGSHDSVDRARTVSVPVVGVVAAGLPILATQNIDRMVQVEERLARPPHKYFLLRIQGTSMNRAGMENGDLVLVRQQPTANNGDRVVALIDDKATVKVLRVGDGIVALEPRSTNPRHQPIYLTTDFQVQGVVIATIKDTKGD
jgi:repressor LexA